MALSSETEGLCPQCERTMRLTEEGVVVDHPHRGDVCAGSGQAPVSRQLGGSAVISEAERVPPSATLIGVGLALFLGSSLPTAIVFMGDVGPPFGSGVTFWAAVGALMHIVGLVLLAVGVTRLARKADVSFRYTQERHDTWRQELHSRSTFQS